MLREGIGKLAALCVQDFDDPVALASVSEVETLTTGLSRKIWQKAMILQSVHGDEARAFAPNAHEESPG